MSAFHPGDYVEPYEELISMARSTYELFIKPYVRESNHKRALQCLLKAVSDYVRGATDELADQFAEYVGIEADDMVLISDNALHTLSDNIRHFLGGDGPDDKEHYAAQIAATSLLKEGMLSLEGPLWTDAVEEPDPLPLPPAPVVQPAVPVPPPALAFYPVPVPAPAPVPAYFPVTVTVMMPIAPVSVPHGHMGSWPPVFGHPAHQG